MESAGLGAQGNPEAAKADEGEDAVGEEVAGLAKNVVEVAPIVIDPLTERLAEARGVQNEVQEVVQWFGGVI